MTTTKKKTTTTRKKSTTATKKPAVKKSTPQKVPDLPTNPFAYEVFDAVSKMRSKALKVEVLQRYNDPSIRALLIWNFDENVISQLPPGEVPYGNTKQDEMATGTLSDKINDAVGKMNEMGSNSLGSQDQGRTTIRKEYKMFYNFIKGGNSSLTSLRRETMFINILEGLHPLEAEILILVKDKKLGEKYKITQEVVAEAFPQINWGVNRSR
tara:strand:+ start:575 stop:1207 length:633 start_codon:yes stop_codon:yes gene_type:complete